MSLPPPLLAGICITATVTFVATAYALTKPRLAEPVIAQPMAQSVSASCQAIANDPQPPLNVRSTPDDASNNIVGTLPNGTILTVINSHRKWVQISTPIAGWVYEDLIRQSCHPTATLPGQLALARANDEPGEQILQLAMSHYQAGNLAAALTELKTVPPDSTAYRKAQLALTTLPAQWQQAELQYHQAKLAYKAGKWQDVIKQVNQFPDIRVWRERLTPIVKQAIENQKKVTTTAHSQAN